MKKLVQRLPSLILGGIASIAIFTVTTGIARAQRPAWIDSSVIYCVNTEIFSSGGNFAGVTAQIPRLKTLGVKVIWLMPLHPQGQPVSGHPWYNSPYAISNHYGINPNFGSSNDLKTLISTAHANGIKVIMDAVLNHTSWDNPLIQQHPEYYKHTDGNPNNPNSVAPVSGLADIAQFDYSNTGLRTYITDMCKSWIQNYDVDGFRFDMASNPENSNRWIPKDFWQSLRAALRGVKSDALLLGECQDVDLAVNPFDVDYGNRVQYRLWNTSHYAGGVATEIKDAWNEQQAFPTGVLHMNFQDNWDVADRDIRYYSQEGNTTAFGALAAATYNFTMNGVPLVYNGMEVGNDAGTFNPHEKINWNSPNASFQNFYRDLIALRTNNVALQQGTVSWLTNSQPSNVVSFLRSGGGADFLVVINLKQTTQTGTISGLPSGSWQEVTPAGGPGGQSHTAPPNFSLASKDFAIFKRGAATIPASPLGLTATAGDKQVSLSWQASTGADTYNLYRATTSGGEGTTPIVSGITGTSYVNTGLTNGTTYYYKVAAVNSVGTSGQSSEASAKPAVAVYTGTPYLTSAVSLPGTIEFEYFDNGGQGVAYNDSDTANNGGAFRTTDRVDIEACSEGGYNVGWNVAGEWLKYSVNVQTAGTYTASFRVASGIASGVAGTFHVEDETGRNMTGTVTINSTGGWQNWVTITAPVTLTTGSHVLKVVIDSANGGFNLNKMTFGTTTYTGTPYSGTAVSLPGKVYLVNYDKGGEGVAYHDSEAANQGGQYRSTEGIDIETSSDSTSNGYSVGWNVAGEWLKYSVNVQTAKTYTVAFRVASGIASGTAGTFHLEDETGRNLTGTVTVNATGGWQTWTTVNASATLTTGQHVFRLVEDSGNGSFNISTMTFN